MSIDLYQKGLSDRHDTPLTQVQAEGYLPQIQLCCPSLAQHLIHLLQQVLVFTQERAALQARACRPRAAATAAAVSSLVDGRTAADAASEYHLASAV